MELADYHDYESPPRANEMGNMVMYPTYDITIPEEISSAVIKSPKKSKMKKYLKPYGSPIIETTKFTENGLMYENMNINLGENFTNMDKSFGETFTLSNHKLKEVNIS